MANVKLKLIDALSDLAPFLAPVATAYMIGEATVRVLDFPVSVAVISALAVETLGVSISDTVITFYQYNQGKRKTDPPAPLNLALAVLSFYIITAICLTVFLDRAETLSRALFPLLTLTGIVTLALRSDHARLRAEIASEKRLRREERRAAPVTRKAPVEPVFVCGVCGYTTPKQQSLAAHSRIHARGVRVVPGNGNAGHKPVTVTQNKESLQ